MTRLPFPWLLSVVVLLAACATPTVLISEEEHCTRYGGLWRAGLDLCERPGGGGGGM